MFRVAWWLIVAWAVNEAIWTTWVALGIPFPGEIGGGLISYGVLLTVVAVYARNHLGDPWSELLPARGMPVALVIPIAVAALGWVVVSWQMVRFFEALNVLPPEVFALIEEPYAPVDGPLLQALVPNAVFPAIFEEALFRGVVLHALAASMSKRRAIVVSALLFAVVHFRIERTSDTFLHGIIFGWLYMRTGSLLPCMLAHFLHNTMAMVILKSEMGPAWDPWISDYGLLPIWVGCLGAALVVVSLLAIRMIPRRRMVPAEAW